MPNYPAQIDNSTSLPRAVDNLTPVQASIFNPLRDAVLSIEGVLGVNPNGIYSTVAGRLTTLENLFNGTPIIEIAQDIGGTAESPLVIGLQGRPVADTSPTSGQSLVWNGIAWVPATVSGGGSTVFGGDLQGISGFQTVIGLQNHPVSSIAPTTGQVLEWNGTSWIPSNPPSGFTAGGDLTGSSTSQTVVGLRGHGVPAPFGSNTFLEWTGSTFTWAAGGGGGGNLTGDVNGPSNSNVINYIQGALTELPQNNGPAPLGTTYVTDEQANGAITAVPLNGQVVSMYPDTTTGKVWIASVSQIGQESFMPTVHVVDATTLQTTAEVLIPHFFRSNGAATRLLVGDPTTNFIYAVAPQNMTSNLVAIIDKTTYQTVGYLNVGSQTTIVSGYGSNTDLSTLSGGSLNVASTTGFPGSGNIFVMTHLGQQNVSYTGTTPTSFTGISGGSGIIFPDGEVVRSGQGKARNVAPDLTGNVWVADNNNDAVSKFLVADIAAAITNYPIPQSASGPVVSGLNSAEQLAWDTTTNTLFIGGFSNPYTLTQVDSSGAIVQQNNTFTASQFFGYHGMVSYQGFIWASGDGSTILKIDPTIFDNTSAAYTTINTTTIWSGDITIDTFNQSILVQDQRFGNISVTPVITRIAAPSGSIVSTITLPYTFIGVGSSGAALPQSNINVNSTQGFPPSGVIYVQTDAGTQVVSYTGTTVNSFLGCAGGVGNMSLDNNVSIGSIANHGWITAVAPNAETLFIGDERTPLGFFVYNSTIGSESFIQQAQPSVLQYANIVWQNNGTTLGANPAFPAPNPTPIRYFNITGTGFTFSEQVGNDGNLVATLNLTGGGGGGSLTVENQGGSLGSGFTSLNFTGAGVTASGSVPNATITIPGFTAGGDISGTTSSQTVTGIRGNVVPTPSGTNTFLEWTGSAFTWAAGGGGAGYQTIQQNGGPLTQRSTLNFPTGVKITDDATNTRTTVNMVLTDNNQAGRTRNRKNLRSNGFTGSQYGDVANIIGVEIRQGGYANAYGRSICSIGDNVYFAGYDGTNYGALYGINTYTNQSLTAPATPIHVYNTFNPGVHQDGPTTLISFRSNVQNNFTGTGTLSGNYDYIFAGGSYTTTFAELGYLTNNGSTYTQVWRNDTWPFSGPIYYAAPLWCSPLTCTTGSSSNNVSLPQPIVYCNATARFPSSGSFYIATSNGYQIVNYTGTTVNSFTGCTGGSGTMTTGNLISLTPNYNHPCMVFIDHNEHLYVLDGSGNLEIPYSTNNVYALATDDEQCIYTIQSSTLLKIKIDLTTFGMSATVISSVGLNSGPNSYSGSINQLYNDGRYLWGIAPNADPLGQSWLYQIDMHTMAFTGVFFPVSIDTYTAETETPITFDGENLWVGSISFDNNWVRLYKISPTTGEILWVSPVINNLAHLGFGNGGGLTLTDSGDVFFGYGDYNASLGPTLYLYRASKNANSVHAHSLTVDVPFQSGFQVGSVTLSGGTATVNTGITITNVNTTKIMLTPTTSNAISGGVRYTVTSKTAGGPGTGAFTVEAIGSSGSIVTDTSVLDYVIMG